LENKFKSNISIKSELFLILASRAQHLEQVIKPSLLSGKWVICSRFIDSTYAYQGDGRGIDHKKISLFHHYILDDFYPNFTILFDLSVKESLKRLSFRKKLDFFEKENFYFFQKIRNSFLNQAKKNPQKYYIINAEYPINIIHKKLYSIVTKIINYFKFGGS